jgi:hypothetical protein
MKTDGQTLQISATMAAPASIRWLERTRTGSVLHIFPDATNLVNEAGEVLSLVKRFDDMGPFSILLDDQKGNTHKSFTSDWWMDIDSRIVTASGNLSVGEVSIIVDNAQVWNPRVEWKSLTYPIINDAQKDMSNSLESNAPPDSIAMAFISTPRTATENEVVNSWKGLSSALLNQDLDLLTSNTRRLAGLGGGLTPAGDDFLMGVIYAMWSLGEAGRSSMIESLVSAAVPLTTTLSSAWLKAAASGEAALRWHYLVDAICSGDGSNVADAVRRMAAVGHSSGADALAGYLATLDLFTAKIAR